MSRIQNLLKNIGQINEKETSVSVQVGAIRKQDAKNGTNIFDKLYQIISKLDPFLLSDGTENFKEIVLPSSLAKELGIDKKFNYDYTYLVTVEKQGDEYKAVYPYVRKT